MALRWLPPKEAAHANGISVRTLRRWVSEGVVLARRLSARRGSIRVAVDGDGLTVPVSRSGA